MRLHHLDLNMLMVLDALVALRSVSKAARQLNVGQPAVSAALARLRTHFEDPLFHRSGGEMVPTALAQQLAGPVREVLHQAELIAQTRSAFEPMLSPRRRFTLSASDYTLTVLMPRVVTLLASEAPQVQLALRHTPIPSGPELQPATEALDRRQHDFTVAPSGAHSDRHRHEVLLEDEYRCVVRRDHPQVRDTLTLDDYAALGHVVAQYDDGRINFVEATALERAGVIRRIVTVVDGFTLLAEVAAASDCVATLPRRLAVLMAQRLPLRVLPVPVTLPPLIELLQWKPLHDADPGMVWMRGVLRRAAADC